jgi:tetratricopeptide (TPR) repeat protein
MLNGLREKLVLVAGSLSVAALICGIGLLLKTPTSGAAPVREPETEQPKSAGEASAHGEGKQKEASGKTAPAHGSEKAHGGAASEKHGAETAKGGEAKGGHGAEAAEGNDAAPGGAIEVKYTRSPDTTVDFEVLCNKGDAAAACGRYDDAIRYYTLALKNIPPEKKSECVLRLADATRLSPSLPAQLRAQKALEGYSRILAEDPKCSVAGEAQFQVGNCLATQNRWQEGLEAFNRYEKNYPIGPHSQEVRYRRAEGLSILGNPDQAGEILEQLVQEEQNPERKSRAILLLARVKLQMVRTDAYTPAQGLPEMHREEIQARPPEIKESGDTGDGEQPQKGSAPVTAVRQGISVPTPKGVPETQWAGITRCVESGNLREAQRLVRPYMERKDDQAQNALVWAHWARLLKATAERGALDVKMEGIVISSRTE